MSAKVHVCYYAGKFSMPPGYDPPPERFTSTPGDNLTELSGRICYASVNKGAPGRPTPEYFANILEHRHYSVIAHIVDTFEINYVDSAPDEVGRLLWDVADTLHCRPGVWVTYVGFRKIRFCLSLRAVVEWFQHGPEFAPGCGDDVPLIYGHLIDALKPLYPLALSTATEPGKDRFRPEIITIRRVKPEREKEDWCSLHISGVSRDLLGELVRHHWQADPSVESTRYVDKSDTDMILHPQLLRDAPDGISSAPLRGWVEEFQESARKMYRRVFGVLTAAGVNKKSARGAARSCLPGATDTKLVLSLSKFQARHILAQRESPGAEDEFRPLSAEMRKALLAIWCDV